jgi:hypothetical protein
MQRPTALPTVAALLLALLFGACGAKHLTRNPPSGKGTPASAAPTVGFHPSVVKRLAAAPVTPYGG